MLKKILTVTILLFSMVSQGNPLPDERHIYIEGSAEIEVDADEATIRVNLEVINKNAELAKIELDKKSVALVKLCNSLGIDSSDIQASGVRTRQEYKYDEKTDDHLPVGVNLGRRIELSLSEIKNYKNVMHQIITSKISDDIDSILRFSKHKEYTDRALELALKDAKKRATSIAKFQGVRLGKIYSVSEFNLRQPERYLLYSPRKVVGKTGIDLDSIVAADIGKFPDSSLSAIQRVRSISTDPFEAGRMKAIASVYVVYLIK